MQSVTVRSYDMLCTGFTDWSFNLIFTWGLLQIGMMLVNILYAGKLQIILTS